MKRSGIFIIAGIALVAAFLLLRPKAEQPVTTPSPSAITSPTDAEEPAVAAAFKYSDGEIDGPAVVQATQGEVVDIAFSSDVNGTLHLHSYEVMSQVTAGEDATLSVTADTAGRFSVEFHGDGNAQAVVTELEVTP